MKKKNLDLNYYDSEEEIIRNNNEILNKKQLCIKTTNDY